MKKILLILAVASIFCSCNAAPTNVIDSTSIIVEEKVDTIMFSYSNFIEMTYLDEDNMAVIRYDDPDVFDLDHMAYITGRDKWYGDYVDIIIEEDLLAEFMYNYDNYKHTNDFWRKECLDSDWLIEEHKITYLDSTVDLIYYIKQNNYILSTGVGE